MSHSTGQLQGHATATPNRREADGDDGLPVPARNPTRRRSFLWRLWKDPRYDGLRTLLWVCPLTVMIWIYAEREQIRTQTLGGVPVAVVTGDPSRIVTSVNRSANAPTVNLTVSGPQEAIERVQEQLLRGGAGENRLQIVLGTRAAGVGDHSVPVVPELFNLRVFRSNGLTLEGAQPADLLVSVAQMDEATLPVVLSDEARRRMNLEGVAQFSPSKVRVRAPYGLLHPPNRPPPPAVYANLPDDADPLLKPVGVHDGVPFPVTLPGAARDELVTLVPATVDARYTIRAAERTLSLARVPVWVLAAPELTHDYDVVDYPATIPVEVVGPPDQIEQLGRNTDPQTRPVAVLTLGRDDLPNRAKAYDVQRLPPGVSVVKTANAQTIPYRLESRKRGTGEGG